MMAFKFKVIRRTPDGQKLWLVPDSSHISTLGWSDLPEQPIIGGCDGPKEVVGFLGSSWARTGFTKTIGVGDLISIIPEGTDEEIPVFEKTEDSPEGSTMKILYKGK